MINTMLCSTMLILENKKENKIRIRSVEIYNATGS